MKNSFFPLILLVLISFIACEKDDNSNVSPDPQLDQMEKVTALLESYETLDTSAAVKYINPTNFTQHNLTIADGQEGMVNAILNGTLRGATVKTSRIVNDGNFVMTHSEFNIDGNSIVAFNVFRFDDDLIVEHWDNWQAMVGPNPSDRTMIDGETAITDVNETEANKTLVSKFIDEIFISGQTDLLVDYFDGNNYVQHNPAIGDSLSNLQQALLDYSEQGIILKYDQIHQVIGQGNFVLTISEGQFDDQNVAFYDLFRVENGKIAEHWDVVEVIPASDTWANQNGKF